MEETKIFLITYLAAFLGVIPPGLVNMSVAKTGMEYGKKNGVFMAIGASFIVLLQALLAVFLARYIFDNPYIRNMLLRAGLVIFLILTVFFYVKARRDNHLEVHSKKANANSIFKGMIVGLLNVFPIPYFIAVAAALDIGGDISYDLFGMVTFVLAASLGVFTTLYLYVLSFLKMEIKTEVFAKYSNYFMAALMLVLVIITLLRIFYD